MPRQISAVKPKLLFTGGHITPLLAVIVSLKNRHHDWDMIVLGRKNALEKGKEPAEEERLVGEAGVRFVALSAARWPRTISPSAILGFIKFPLGFISAFRLLGELKPTLIVSFGGYVALPVVVVGWLLGIAAITHEQTRRPGLTNRLLAHLVKKICISFPETERFFPRGKTRVTGLPLRNEILAVNPVVSQSDRPLIYVTGGSTGAQSVNSVIFRALPELLSDYKIVHQVGRENWQMAQEIKLKVDPALAQHYIIHPYLDALEHAKVLARAHLVIGRSGANTVWEIAALGKVAIFVPLPWSGNREQFANAEWLEDAGSAEIICQDEFTKKQLLETIKNMEKSYSQFAQKAQAFKAKVKRNGTDNLVRVIESYV